MREQIREQVIFDGDHGTYVTAKKASDGLEHGFLLTMAFCGLAVVRPAPACHTDGGNLGVRDAEGPRELARPARVQLREVERCALALARAEVRRLDKLRIIPGVSGQSLDLRVQHSQDGDLGEHASVRAGLQLRGVLSD
jgi:hypothetical protein